MARRLTDNDILAIQECYSRIGTYSGVAKELGFSPSTVKKYVLLDQSPKTAEEKKEIFSSFEPPVDLENLQIPKDKSEWRKMCSLSEEEIQETLSFTKNLSI